MEKIVTSISVHGHGCVGCQRHRRPVMVTIQDESDHVGCKFVDIFLTEEQARTLVSQVGEAVMAAKDYKFDAE